MQLNWPSGALAFSGISLAAAGAIFFAPINDVARVSQEVIGLFGLLLAGALPAMILTATILRAGAFSPRRIGEYTEALDQQLSFWFALFIWALLACLFTTISKAIWDEHSPFSFRVPAFRVGSVQTPSIHVALSRCLNCCSAYAAAQVILRLLPMLRGLRSLLKLNAQIAKEEAANRTLETKSATAEQIARMTEPKGHGAIVDLPEERPS